MNIREISDDSLVRQRLIDGYFEKNLSARESISFKKQMVSDRSFRREVEIRYDLLRDIDSQYRSRSRSTIIFKLIIGVFLSIFLIWLLFYFIDKNEGNNNVATLVALEGLSDHPLEAESILDRVDFLKLQDDEISKEEALEYVRIFYDRINRAEKKVVSAEARIAELENRLVEIKDEYLALVDKKYNKDLEKELSDTRLKVRELTEEIEKMKNENEKLFAVSVDKGEEGELNFSISPSESNETKLEKENEFIRKINDQQKEIRRLNLLNNNFSSTIADLEKELESKVELKKQRLNLAMRKIERIDARANEISESRRKSDVAIASEYLENKFSRYIDKRIYSMELISVRPVQNYLVCEINLMAEKNVNFKLNRAGILLSDSRRLDLTAVGISLAIGEKIDEQVSLELTANSNERFFVWFETEGSFSRVYTLYGDLNLKEKTNLSSTLSTLRNSINLLNSLDNTFRFEGVTLDN
jgi:hypothetical protein